MKKFIASVFAVVAMACCFTACNTGEGCYYVKVTMTVPGMDPVVEEGYFYGNNDELDAYTDALSHKLPLVPGAGVKTDYLKVAKSHCDR